MVINMMHPDLETVVSAALIHTDIWWPFLNHNT